MAALTLRSHCQRLDWPASRYGRAGCMFSCILQLFKEQNCYCCTLTLPEISTQNIKAAQTQFS